MLDDQLTFVKWIFLSKERLGIASVGWLAARVLDSVFRAKNRTPYASQSDCDGADPFCERMLLVALILLTIGVRTFCLDRRQGVYPTRRTSNAFSSLLTGVHANCVAAARCIPSARRERRSEPEELAVPAFIAQLATLLLKRSLR